MSRRFWFVAWMLLGACSSGKGPFLRSVAFGPSGFVAVGDNSVVVTSPDGQKWTGQTSLTSFHRILESIAFGNGVYVAAPAGNWADSESPETCTSSDGATWACSGFSDYLSALIFANGSFVAGGYTSSSASFFTSPDGKSWTQRTEPNDSTGTAPVIKAIAYSGKLFVAIGANASVYTSTDGVTWSFAGAQVPGLGTSFKTTLCAFGSIGDTFVAFISDGAIQTSTDGKSWTAVTSGVPTSAGCGHALASNGGTMVAVINGKSIISTSTGSTWTAQPYTSAKEPQLLAATLSPDGKLVTVGGSFLTGDCSSGTCSHLKVDDVQLPDNDFYTPPPPPSGTGTTGACASNADCAGFGNRHCSGAGNAFCAKADGLCHCCEVLCSGACQCNRSCSSASSCAPGELCESNFCLFPKGGTPAQ